MATPTTTKGRTLIGTVVSDRMTKTIVVTIDRLKMHPKYKKQYVVTARYTVHDEKGEYHTGDRVIIKEIRPMSKTKRWLAVGKAKNTKN